jgi:integrase
MDVLISHDTRRKKKDNTYPIILRISGNNQTLPIPTGYAVPKAFWDINKREIKKSYSGFRSITRVNNILHNKRNQARHVITQLEEAGTLDHLTIKDIKARIMSAFRESNARAVINDLQEAGVITSTQRYDELLSHLDTLVSSGKLATISLKDYKKYFTDRIKSASVFTFIKRLESDLRSIKKIGYADVHKDTRSFLKAYLGHEDFYFNEITLDFLQKIELWFLQQGNKINSLSVYLRTLRSVYNKAAKLGMADKFASPFGDYQIKSEETAKRNIKEDKVQNIINIELAEDDVHLHTRNYFLASFAMWGMSFIDMAFLRVKNIQGERINYQRSKTSRHYSTKINPLLDAILRFYIKDKEPNEFVFPIIKRKTYDKQYLDVENARRAYNRGLKELAIRCNINEVPLEAISQMLGHSDTRTTKTYLEAFPDNTVDNYADKAFSFMKK